MDALSMPATAARQVAVAGRAVTHLKGLDQESRNQRVAGFVAARALLLPTQAQWALLAGTSSARVSEALNGARRKRAPAAAMADLGVLLQDVAEVAVHIRWQSATVERDGLEELDQLFGRYIAKHESTLEQWRDSSGTTASSLLGQAVRTVDQLLTTILANNTIGG
jgi:hypothetical protein